MFTTPGGKPAFAANSPKMREAVGVRSEGLMIMQFPVMMAIGRDHNGIIAGKSVRLSQHFILYILSVFGNHSLKGHMATVTPSGSL